MPKSTKSHKNSRRNRRAVPTLDKLPADLVVQRVGQEMAVITGSLKDIRRVLGFEGDPNWEAIYMDGGSYNAGGVMLQGGSIVKIWDVAKAGSVVLYGPAYCIQADLDALRDSMEWDEVTEVPVDHWEISEEVA